MLPPPYPPFYGPPPPHMMGMFGMHPGMAMGYPLLPPMPPPLLVPRPSMAAVLQSQHGASGGTGSTPTSGPGACAQETERVDILPVDPFGVEAAGLPAGTTARRQVAPPAVQQQQVHQVQPVLVPEAGAGTMAHLPAGGVMAAASAPTYCISQGEPQQRLNGGPTVVHGRKGALVSKRQVLDAGAQAEQRVQQLFPQLAPALLSWLLHRLVTHYAQVPEEELAGSHSRIDIPLENATAACNAVAYGPAGQVAQVAAQLLEGLQQRYLAGGRLQGSTAKSLFGVKAKGKGVLVLPAQADLPALAQSVLGLVADPNQATPLLPPGAAQGGAGSGGQRVLPPAPPPALRGSIVPVPDPLQPLFAASDVEGGKALLHRLLAGALDRLDVATALAAGQADSQGALLPLKVGPDLDYGTVAVSCLPGGELMQAAASVAAGLPAGTGSGSYAGLPAAAAATGSVLDLLHLSSVRPQQQKQQQHGVPSGNGNITSHAGAGGSDASSQAAAVLHFRQLVIENTSTEDAVWLLGGVAAPAFPHTLAAVDDARLFYLEGHQAVRLDPLQQHTIGVVLSSADCAARRQERGILQQLLLLVFAAPPYSEAARLLREVEGAPCADLPAMPAGSLDTGLTQRAGSSRQQPATEAAASSGSEAAAAAVRVSPAQAAPGVLVPLPATPAAPFRLFVVARRVTVALVDRPAELAALLDADAKPYIAEHLRQLFNHVPKDQVNSFPLASRKLFANGSVTYQPGNVLLQPATAQKGRATAPGLPENTLGTAAGPLLQRYSRLLALEEAAMEQDICRYDAWNVRLRLAVFTAPQPSRYMLVSLAPSSERPRMGLVYRGPAVEALQPGGVDGGGDGSSATHPVYALGVLDVPGLPENRPLLLVGDTVYLRTAHQPQRELAALVAATDGSTAFLLLPPAFWQLPDVAPLVPRLGTLTSFGDSGLFDGLIHVRFSFDRSALHRMHRALSSAALQQLSASACWLPPGDTSAGGGVGGASLSPRASSSSSATAAPHEQRRLAAKAAAKEQQHLKRVKELQPAADDVAQAAASLQEQGRQRLNAEQRQAVAAVVCGGGRAMPYALFGPPGTGKTVTLVECALQLLQAYPQARLLLCAPQNYSADLLCSALAGAGLGPDQLLRMNDPRRPPFTVKDDVLPFCLLSEFTRMFQLPTKEAAEARRVIVCTCGAAALLQEGRFEHHPLAFTHVLIDEAGQALLPEALIPLSLLAPASSEASAAAADRGWGAVLCGDPRQLGPVVRSRAAARAGLGTSLLELCIAHHGAAAYDVLQMGRVPATSMLVKNYRSHSRLLDLPSRLFYQGSLVPAADQSSVLPPRWGELQGEGEQEEEGKKAAAENEGVLPGLLGVSGLRDGPAEEVEEAGGQEAGGGAEEEEEEEGETEQAEGEAEGQAQEEVEEEEGEEEEEEEESVPMASMLFYGVRGKQEREGDAPSWFNPVEASVVVDLISGLLAAAPGVTSQDIGVMAPFRKQVQKIRLLLRQRGLGAIRVGTVDDYQGQEERIIFISTVLSKPESLPPAHPSAPSSDAFLGFWRSPKRFNVAITRAKALLVVAGHPAVLLEDASWRELLRHCFSCGAFRGAGSDTIRHRFRFDAGVAAGALPDVAREPGGLEDEQGDEELQRAIGQLAELALLGGGRADEMFPSSLDEQYAANEEQPFRVML